MKINKAIKVGIHDKIRVFDIAEMSVYDGPGIRTVIYFQGCNAQCEWCHSPQSQPTISPLLLNNGLCSNCNLCSDICKKQEHLITMNSHFIKRDNCNKCGDCITACPNSTEGVAGSALHLPSVETTVSTLFKQIEPYLKLTKKMEV